jgi:hypothetical protein
MKKFIEWHKAMAAKVQVITGWSDYQMLWFGFFKGLFIGWII